MNKFEFGFEFEFEIWDRRKAPYQRLMLIIISLKRLSVSIRQTPPIRIKVESKKLSLVPALGLLERSGSNHRRRLGLKSEIHLQQLKQLDYQTTIEDSRDRGVHEPFKKKARLQRKAIGDWSSDHGAKLQPRLPESSHQQPPLRVLVPARELLAKVEDQARNRSTREK